MARNQFPCSRCGRPHLEWKDGEHTSWGDPVDGHDYYPMSAVQFSRDVLEGRWPRNGEYES